MKQFFTKRGRWIGGHWIPTAQLDVLRLLIMGWSLRSHRDLEGGKHYEMLALSGEKRLVLLDTVQKMRRKRLIETNHKFPSATFLLTGHGEKIARQLVDELPNRPLTARKFTEKD